MFGVSNELAYKSELISIIEKHLHKCKIYLFGSRADGTNRLGSDIDLAIDCDEKIDNFSLIKIRNDIEDSTIPFLVDVLDIHGISIELKNKILRDGILWKS